MGLSFVFMELQILQILKVLMCEWQLSWFLNSFKIYFCVQVSSIVSMEFRECDQVTPFSIQPS